MNKTEELILIGVALLFFFKMMNGNTSALSVAKLNAQTDTTYANDAASVASSFFNNFGNDD